MSSSFLPALGRALQVSEQGLQWVKVNAYNSRKTFLAVALVILTVIIVGYTYKPPVVADVQNVVRLSRVVSWASTRARCDSGMPMNLTAVNRTHFSYCTAAT
jgi:hypothetical protein